jgi:hypothetical protein
MQRQPEPAEIASMILSAPAWVRLALAVRNPRLQERAVDVLADRIGGAMGDKGEPDPRQLALPMSYVELF